MSTHYLYAVCDTSLFIGSSRPMQAGEVHHSESLFPPPPSTFQGAMRASLYRSLQDDGHSMAETLARVGPPHRMAEGWEIDGPWVAAVTRQVGPERLEPWATAPLCCQFDEESKTWTLRQVTPRPKDLLLDPDAPELLVQGAEPEGARWIPAGALYDLLSTGQAKCAGTTEPPFARWESRSGLALKQDERTAEDGMLYFQRRIRMGATADHCRAGFAAWVSAPDGTNGADGLRRIRAQPLLLGRRNRPLSFDADPPDILQAWQHLQAGEHLRRLPESRLPDGMEAWLVLASPVALDQPTLGSPARPCLPWTGKVQITVRSAVVGRTTRLGGVSLAGEHGVTPRAVRTTLQPGASWRIRLVGGGPEDRRQALARLHHRCTLGDENSRTFGFGRTWISLLPEDLR